MRCHLIIFLICISFTTIIAQEQLCYQHGTIPSQCPNDYFWNTRTCAFECKPHCTSNEGNFVPVNTTYHVLCNTCTCETIAAINLCTRVRCNTNVCYDDDGQRYNYNTTLIRGCKTGICSINGKWNWTDPSLQQPPICAYGNATYNTTTCSWDCPTTCSDGLSSYCLFQPCSIAQCGEGMICVDNLCPNYPINGNGRCTAKCVTPVNCAVDPCQGSPCGNNQTCQADYRFGCGYTCHPTTCDYNGHIYHINETFPSSDGCNICTCASNGQALCTLRPCPNTISPPTTPCIKVCIWLCAIGKSCQADEHGCVECRNITTTTSPPTCPKVCIEDCIVGESCQPDENGCVSCQPIQCTYNNFNYHINATRDAGDGCNECTCQTDESWKCTERPCKYNNSTTSPPASCLTVCIEDCIAGTSCQPDENGCVACRPINGTSPPTSCPTVCIEDCIEGTSCQPDDQGCVLCRPINTCVYNNITYSINDTRPAGDGCNTCTCLNNGNWICTLRACSIPTPTSTPITSSTPTPPSNCGSCTISCIRGSQCIINPTTCQPSCQPIVCPNTCLPVHCSTGTTCYIDTECNTSCVSKPGIVLLTAIFTINWSGTTSQKIVNEMRNIASQSGISTVFIINIADVTSYNNNQWNILIGIKGNARTDWINSLNAFITMLSYHALNSNNVYTMNANDNIQTIYQAMSTQTCQDGTNIGVDQTCPNAVSTPTSSSTPVSSSSSSSSSNQLIVWVVPIVIGVVLIVICVVGLIIMHDRRHHPTVKNVDPNQLQSLQQQNTAPQAWGDHPHMDLDAHSRV